ncbi:MAG: phenylacetate--CoA ligase family protein [Ktedonobacteraceae bacterium]
MAAISVDSQNQQPLESFSASLQHESWTRQQLENYQARALHACREYAYAHSPFYQRFHKGLMDRPLQELPVLTKAMMMDHFDELVTDRAVRLYDVQQYLARENSKVHFLDRYQVMATSGSAGQPGVFLSNATERAITTNSYTRFQLWGGLTPNSKLAVVGSLAPGHASSQITMMVNGQPISMLQLSASHPVDKLVQMLNEWQPDTLMWYSSIAVILSNEQREGRLHINPRSLFCGAETLTGDMRRRIEEAWQMKIFDAYATTEGGVLAAECTAHQGLHLFEDYSIIEVVDQDNRPVPPGEQGDKVLLTVLFRRTQPLIRYEVTDLVRASTGEHCLCGRPFALIDSIQGRTADILHLPSPSGKEEKIYPYLFLNVFDSLPVSGWQVIQELDGLHVFLTGASEELRNEQVCNRLQKAFIDRGVLVPPIEIKRVEELAKNARGGKARMVISRVPRNTT